MESRKLLSILLVCTSAAIVVVEGMCPNAADISPCFCQQTQGVSVTTCSNLRNVGVLKNLAKKSNGYTYAEVIIKDSNLPSIPRDVLEKVRTKSIVLDSLTLNSLFDDIPRTMSSLKKITLRGVKVNDRFTWNYFQHTKDIETLIVERVSIPVITSDFNTFVTHALKVLSFNFTETAEIQRDALKDFRNLNEIIISNNKLTEIFRRSLPQPFYGKILDFKNNQLTTVREDLFTNMPNILEISLTGNSISTLEEPSENGILERIEKINILSNPLDCSCNLKWIADAKKSIIIGKCASPENLRGKYLSALSRDDFSDC